MKFLALGRGEKIILNLRSECIVSRLYVPLKWSLRVWLEILCPLLLISSVLVMEVPVGSPTALLLVRIRLGAVGGGVFSALGASRNNLAGLNIELSDHTLHSSIKET